MSAVEERSTIAACSFCLKPNTEVATLVAGPGVFICDGCVNLCVQVMENKSAFPQLAPWEEDLPVDDILANLPRVAAAGAQTERNLGEWVHKVGSQGATWARVGEALGMTRQATWERFSGEE